MTMTTFVLENQQTRGWAAYIAEQMSVFRRFPSQDFVRVIVDTRDKTANTTLDNEFVQDLSLALTGVPV